MNEPTLEVLPPASAIVVKTPEISVTEAEAAEILSELDLISLKATPSVENAPTKKQVGIDVRRALRLGIFVEENAVRLDNGKIFIADQILLNHLQRLNAAANEMKTAAELKEIAYPIGYVAGQIKKSSKTKIVVEAVQGGAGRPNQESWMPGQKVLPAASGS
jgi:hypothetical protein